MAASERNTDIPNPLTWQAERAIEDNEGDRMGRLWLPGEEVEPLASLLVREIVIQRMVP